METQNDCCDLNGAEQDAFISNLEGRYSQRKIYTYVAKLLVTVNPYTKLEELYGRDKMKNYMNYGLFDSEPHAYATAAQTHMQLKSNNQSIIVCGNSGSGKTETSKHIISFLCENSDQSMQEKIISSNCLIEVFGNAKTTLNENSSRFVKLIQLYYDEQFEKICGAKISHHSLELSRVTNDNYGQFQIFKLLLNGAPNILKEVLYLKGNDKSDAIANFNKADGELSCFGVSDDQKFQIYRILALIYHLANIHFEDIKEEDGCKLTPSSLEFFEAAAHIVGVQKEDLKEFLTTENFQTKADAIKIPQNKSGAYKKKNSMAKILYDFLFQFITSTVNNSLRCMSLEKSAYIAVLDIAGFENFESSTNCFEQFTINYTNEKLQNFWSTRLIIDEQKWYIDEGMDIGRVDFFDNSKILDLFENKSKGLFALLDNESKVNLPSGKNFLQNVFTQWHSNRAIKPSKFDSCLTICHFSGDVTYDAMHFIDKNSEKVSSSVQSMFCRVTKSFNVEEKIPNTSSKSACFSLRYQTTSLINQLKQTNSHFIRCIKPNSSNKMGLFDREYVSDQLKSAGTFAYYRLMRKGYPLRMDIQEFFAQYQPHLQKNNIRIDAKKLLQILFHHNNVPEHEYRFGATSVMLRSGQHQNIIQLKQFEEPIISINVDIVMKKLVARSKWTLLIAAAKLYLRFVRSTHKKTSILTIINLSECPAKSTKKFDSSESANEVRQEIPTIIQQRNPKKIGPRPSDTVRYDRIDHLPDKDSLKSSTRCKMPGCKQRTHVFCLKCKCHLCFTVGRNCFKNFHLQ